MYDFVRLSGFGRLRGVGHGSKVAGQHHRHASPDRLLADGMGKAALGQGYLGFLSKQHGLLFRPAGSSPDALFRCDCRRVLADFHSYGGQYGIGFSRHGTRASMGKKTWSI